MNGGDGSGLAALLAFELCFWVDKKRKARFAIMLSRRAAKRASLCFVDTETRLKGRSSGAATLSAERWRRRQHGPWRRRTAAACSSLTRAGVNFSFDERISVVN